VYIIFTTICMFINNCDHESIIIALNVSTAFKEYPRQGKVHTWKKMKRGGNKKVECCVTGKEEEKSAGYCTCQNEVKQKMRTAPCLRLGKRCALEIWPRLPYRVTPSRLALVCPLPLPLSHGNVNSISLFHPSRAYPINPVDV
jgi:hypothetical protein